MKFFSNNKNYFLGFQRRILSTNRYKNSIINNKLKNALKKEPILIFAEPIGSTISSHVATLLEINGLRSGKTMSLMIDCIKFKAAIPIINATEIDMILYSLRNSVNHLKIAMIILILITL